MLSFGEAVRQFYGNYLNAEGRAQRSAYWWVVLYQLIIGLVFVIVILMADGGLGIIETIANSSTIEDPEDIMADLGEAWSALGFSGKAAAYSMVLFSLVNFIPDIMLRIRRFHDLDKSGWLVLVFFISGNLPLAGLNVLAGLVNLIWFIFRGTSGSNKYGADPLGHDANVFR